MKVNVQVFVRLKPGVLDVQGKAVEQGIAALGIEGVSGVRIGKLIEMQVEAASAEAAKSEVEALCQKLLANTVIENFEIKTS